MGNTTSIDDLLMGIGNSQQPETPEHKDMESAPIEEMEPDVKDDSEGNFDYDSGEDDRTNDADADSDAEHQSHDDHTKDENEEDEYGNPKERMSKGMQERLDRKEKQHKREMEQRDFEINQLRQQLAQQGASPQVQKAAKDFEYDPNSEGDWQQQLAAFVRQEVSNMNQETVNRQKQQEDQQVQREFEQRFTQGMGNFEDFREVVANQPIDDAMTMALRGMQDPAAFIYAASKRNPEELQRISKLRDPYARMVEMGKLEERMRRNKPTTKAPRPLGRAPEDATTNAPKEKKNVTGDDLLANADAKRLNTVKQRHRGNR